MILYNSHACNKRMPNLFFPYFFLDSATKTFEPQVNTPALSSFVIIAFIFSLLLVRINQVR